MSKHSKKESSIVTFAYLHRYGLFLLTVICAVVFSQVKFLVLGIASSIYAIWSFIGYRCRWKHIFCSYQSLYHKRMTPNKIKWDFIKKSDAYGLPIIFGVLGLGCLLCHILLALGI